MADFDFLDGFDTGGDWGFTGVSSKPSDQTVADSKATQQVVRSEEHTSELQSRLHLVYRLLLEKKKQQSLQIYM